METILEIDVAETIMALVAFGLAASPILLRITRKLNGIHKLVNSAMTQQKRERVDDLLEHASVLESVFEEPRTPAQKKLLDHNKQRIRRLQKEIERRDAQEDQVKGFPEK